MKKPRRVVVANKFLKVLKIREDVAKIQVVKATDDLKIATNLLDYTNKKAKEFENSLNDQSRDGMKAGDFHRLLAIRDIHHCKVEQVTKLHDERIFECENADRQLRKAGVERLKIETLSKKVEKQFYTKEQKQINKQNDAIVQATYNSNNGGIRL